MFSQRFIWWAWAGFAERWDDSYTPHTLHLLPFVCLPSVRAHVKQSYQTLSLSFFMPWDGKVWSKSLFKACQFTCRASWKFPPAVLFCVDNRHANTAAVFFQSLTLVKIILQYRAKPATNLVNIKLIYKLKKTVL